MVLLKGLALQTTTPGRPLKMWECPRDKTSPSIYLSMQSLSISLTLSHVYRGAGGYWRKYDATQLATPEAFMANPSLVWEFYSHRREVASTKVCVFIMWEISIGYTLYFIHGILTIIFHAHYVFEPGNGHHTMM